MGGLREESVARSGRDRAVCRCGYCVSQQSGPSSGPTYFSRWAATSGRERENSAARPQLQLGAILNEATRKHRRPRHNHDVGATSNHNNA